MKYLFLGVIAAIAMTGSAFITTTDHMVHFEPYASPEPIPEFLNQGITWLANAQFEHGGWGSGLHARQDIRDPKAVQIDPATTAFSAMALFRAGHTLNSGQYSQHVRKAFELLLTMVEDSPENTYNITSVTGTQPQRKLGQNIDVAMTLQFLMKVKPYLMDEETASRTDHAINKCIAKLEMGQNSNGSFRDGGWAPVLQSAMATSALEMAKVVGYQVNERKIRAAIKYQNQNTRRDADRPADAAGIQLYALSSTQRASASDAEFVEQSLDMDEMSDPIEFEEEIVTGLMKRGTGEEEARALAESYVANRVATQRLQDDEVWRGFGNNGGEEFLSYMMTSESMAKQGGEAWENWFTRMTNNLSAIQNGNGSWSGHHCITSPVFCTAAVILAVTANQDQDVVAVAK